MHDFEPQNSQLTWWHVLSAWVFAALLLSSWLYCHGYWNACDAWVYKQLHHSLSLFPLSKYLWANLNSRLGDWLLEGGIILVACYESWQGRYRRCKWLGIGFIVVFLAHILLHNLRDFLDMDWIRLSPSVVLGVHVNLTSWSYWPNNKVWSVQSFPGDHAISLWMMGFWFYYVVRPYFIPMAVILIFAAIPRLIAGSHWFSDVAVGALAWALLTTPLSFKVLLSINKYKNDWPKKELI